MFVCKGNRTEACLYQTHKSSLTIDCCESFPVPKTKPKKTIDFNCGKNSILLEKYLNGIIKFLILLESFVHNFFLLLLLFYCFFHFHFIEIYLKNSVWYIISTSHPHNLLTYLLIFFFWLFPLNSLGIILWKFPFDCDILSCDFMCGTNICYLTFVRK